MDDQFPNNEGNPSWPTYMASPYGQSSTGPYGASLHLHELQQSHGTPPSFSEMLQSQQSASEPSQSQTCVTPRGNWSILEDTRLCHAWVRVSTDPITGSDQKKNSFWGRVFDDFKGQHGVNESIRRNQKACDLRMQHIKADLKKWSAALKRVLDCPRSGLNLYGIEQSAHALYRGQHNKPFKLEHCWDILNKCQTWMRFMVPLPPTGSASYATPPRLPSHSVPVLEDTPLSVGDAQGVEELLEIPLHAATNISTRSNNDVEIDDVGDEHQSPPSRKRPIGRKTAKRAKRMASIEAQKSLGERVAKSLEDMSNSNSVGWNKTTELHEQELRATVRHKNMQIIIGRMVIEKEAMTIDKLMFDADPSALGSAPEKSRIFHERRKKITELQAQADALVDVDIQSGGGSGSGDGCNLLNRFDEEDRG